MTLMAEVPAAVSPEVLLSIAAAIAPSRTPAGWDTPLTEAGFDSLTRLELAVRVEEQLHRPVPDSVLLDVRTLRDLHTHLAGAR